MSSLPDIKKKMRDCHTAIQWAYDNCDENSEFFEAISDAWLLFNQANRAVESYLEDEQRRGVASPPDTH